MVRYLGHGRYRDRCAGALGGAADAAGATVVSRAASSASRSRRIRSSVLISKSFGRAAGAGGVGRVENLLVRGGTRWARSADGIDTRGGVRGGERCSSARTVVVCVGRRLVRDCGSVQKRAGADRVGGIATGVDADRQGRAGVACRGDLRRKLSLACVGFFFLCCERTWRSSRNFI